MANQFASAFAELQACAAAEIGAAQTVTINGADYAAVVSEITKDDMLIHGGSGEKGGFKAEILASLFASPPVKQQSFVYLTTTLSVLSFEKINEATYLIVAGDFTLNE